MYKKDVFTRNRIMKALIPPMIWLTRFLENLNRGLSTLKPGPIGKLDRTLGRVLYGSDYLPSADLEAMAEALGIMARAGKMSAMTMRQEIEPYQPPPEYEEMLHSAPDWKPGRDETK